MRMLALAAAAVLMTTAAPLALQAHTPAAVARCTVSSSVLPMRQCPAS